MENSETGVRQEKGVKHVAKITVIASFATVLSILYFAGIFIYIPSTPFGLAVGLYLFLAFIVASPYLFGKIKSRQGLPEKDDAALFNIHSNLDLDPGKTTSLVHKCEKCGFLLTSSMKTCPDCGRINPHYHSG
jgi:hypothetical protein